MSGIRYRRRGTAIIETERGIILTAGHRGSFILPGGGAERGESRFVAAIRELKEETGLATYFAEIIFRHKGKIQPTHSGRHKFQDQHTVCLVKASGIPRPGGGDAKRIAYYYPGCGVRISTTTKEIIEKYYEWKRKQAETREPNIFDEDDDIEDVEGRLGNDYDDVE
jgi:8-oxo-dGTP diphosphatase